MGQRILIYKEAVEIGEPAAPDGLIVPIERACLYLLVNGENCGTCSNIARLREAIGARLGHYDGVRLALAGEWAGMLVTTVNAGCYVVCFCDGRDWLTLTRARSKVTGDMNIVFECYKEHLERTPRFDYETPSGHPMFFSTKAPKEDAP